MDGINQLALQTFVLRSCHLTYGSLHPNSVLFTIIASSLLYISNKVALLSSVSSKVVLLCDIFAFGLQ